ncbi:MAG: hypothetical protein EHM85_05530 [Desulfobacteraceae bacterium]|nr:MAG: hypothetical protein EHM85_05530 [Desulfobacteraceae bacterium]
MDNEKYLFRRQFVLGPSYIKSFPKWNRVSINDKFFLSVHPDLNVLKVTFKENTIILLGYILDPLNHSFNNQDIINSVAEKISVADDIFQYIDSMCGRFVFIVKINDEVRIFNDAAGYRQIFYYTDDKNNLWCGSQPSIIAEEFGLGTDQSMAEDLSKLPLIRDEGARWYPGNITLYKGIYHLTPNHYLDLKSGEVKRYWPVKSLETISPEKAAEYSSKLLQGAFESAFQRYNLALTVTAGYDTRVLLAACKMLREKIHYLTHTHGDLDENGSDIQIPRKLLERYGLKHHIAHHSNRVDDDFQIIFKRNVTGAKDLHSKNANAFLKYFESIGTEMVVAQGEAGGLGKRFYRLPPFFRVNEKTLATVVGMRGSRTAERAIGEWLKSANQTVNSGINILDLLYWEMRLGNWSTLAVSSYDIVFETLLPFNCRKLLECFISVDINYRLTKKNTHLCLIEHMWPELLEFPLNPAVTKKDEIMTKIKGKEFYGKLRFLKFTYHYLFGSK